MLSPCYTIDRSQAERCIKACVDRTIISEAFGHLTVTGKVQSVVDNRDATPRSWSITFVDANTQG